METPTEEPSEPEAPTQPEQPSEPHNEKYEPTVTDIEVVEGTPITEDDVKSKVALTGLPSGTEITAVGEIPSTDEAGDKTPVPVTVTYPDGTTDVVEVPVKVLPAIISLPPLVKDYVYSNSNLENNEFGWQYKFTNFPEGREEGKLDFIWDTDIVDAVDAAFPGEYANFTINVGQTLAAGFTDDPNDSQPDKLKEITITSLPIADINKLILVNGTEISEETIGQKISVQELQNLYFVSFNPINEDIFNLAREQLKELVTIGKLSSSGLSSENIDMAKLEEDFSSEALNSVFDAFSYYYTDTGDGSLDEVNSQKETVYLSIPFMTV